MQEQAGARWILVAKPLAVTLSPGQGFPTQQWLRLWLEGFGVVSHHARG